MNKHWNINYALFFFNQILISNSYFKLILPYMFYEYSGKSFEEIKIKFTEEVFLIWVTLRKCSWHLFLEPILKKLLTSFNYLKLILQELSVLFKSKDDCMSLWLEIEAILNGLRQYCVFNLFILFNWL